MDLGEVYEVTTWEQDDEWTYDKSSYGRVDRFKAINYSTDFGAFVGMHGRYGLFVVSVPNEHTDTYKILYIEDDLWIRETDFETNIPILDKIIRYVNSREFVHPAISKLETTSIEVPEADILDFSERYASGIKKNIKNAREKHRTLRTKRKAGKKISNWMSIIPPLPSNHEMKFSGGPLYKRAESSFKSSASKRTRKRRNV